jgi:hypothetical protein
MVTLTGRDNRLLLWQKDVLKRLEEMDSLHKQCCEICRAGGPLASAEERAADLSQLPGWQVIAVAGVDHLEKVFHL